MTAKNARGPAPELTPRIADLHLTTTEVADLLDVHPSTVKRWCNSGELEYDTTSGGHRRIHLDAVMETARDRDIETFLSPFEPYAGHVWTAVRAAADEDDFSRARSLLFGWLRRGHLERIRRLLYAVGSHPEIPLVRFFDGLIREFMTEVGRAWADGRIRVGDEHLASQAVIDSLLRMREDWRDQGILVRHDHGDGPSAVVGSMGGDQHHLGSMCIRLLLEREGWDVAYLGPNVPIEEFAAVQRARRADLVGISLAPPLTGADVQRAVRVLREFHRPGQPYAVAFGGGPCRGLEIDDDPAPFAALRCFDASEPFQAWLNEDQIGLLEAS